MEASFTIAVITIYLTSSVIFATILWGKRKEVPDRSRTFLSLSFLLFSPFMIAAILLVGAGKVSPFPSVIQPILGIGGLYAIILIMYYPLEVIRPRWLTGWKLLIPISPAIIATIPFLIGMHFQDIQTINDIKENLTDIDVLIRLITIALVVIVSLFIMIIPYNWRKSSANKTIIRRYVILSEITSIIFLTNCFSGSLIITNINILWCVFLISQLTYYELNQRIIPPIETQNLPDDPEPVSNVADDNQTDDLWQRINHQMDKHEIWRNPDVTVEMMSRAVGTNRIYVADSIREHTGLTFNDYLNKWRTEYMADKLRQNPAQDQKPLYFEIGYRNRQTAYRNFIKFIGCSPSDFIASL